MQPTYLALVERLSLVTALAALALMLALVFL